MPTLTIPSALAQEFATVAAVWHSNGETRRVDALLLSWIKHEKQLRRLFCFLLYQHPNIRADNIDTVITALANERKLYPETFVVGINDLGVGSLNDIVGPRYAAFKTELD